MPDPSTEQTPTTLDTTEGRIEGVSDAPTGDNPEAPTGQDGGEPKQTLVDVLAQALTTEEETPKQEAAEEKGEEKGEEPDPEALQSAEDAKLPFHQHPRWRQVYSEAKQLRQDKASLEAEREELAPRIKALDELTDYCTAQGVSEAEFNTGVTLIALVKNNPAKALEALRPIMKRLEADVGEGELPPELADEVSQGLVTEERAREIVRLKAGAKLRDGQDAEAKVKADAQARSAHEAGVKANIEQVRAAVSKLEQQWLSTDADYKKIGKQVAANFKVWVYEHGKIPTADEALKAVTKIRDDLKAEVEGWGGQRPTPPPNPRGAGGRFVPSVDNKPATSLTEHLARQLAK